MEDSAEWIARVNATAFSSLPPPPAACSPTVHAVVYNGSVAEADSFFAAPWLMRMPHEVDATCYDVILVDAPMGWQAANPGRMEAAWYALHSARRCLADGRSRSVAVFLHDAQRPVEARIAADWFGTLPLLVNVEGPRGRLQGWRLGRA